MANVDNDRLLFPDDIFSYENDAFYTFVHHFLGDIEADILRIQCIRNARLLLLVPNIFSLFELECEDLLDLKKRACFVISNLHFVVKPGVRFNIEYLVGLVRSKYATRSISNPTTSLPVIAQAPLKEPLQRL